MTTIETDPPPLSSADHGTTPTPRDPIQCTGIIVHGLEKRVSRQAEHRRLFCDDFGARVDVRRRHDRRSRAVGWWANCDLHAHYDPTWASQHDNQLNMYSDNEGGVFGVVAQSIALGRHSKHSADPTSVGRRCLCSSSKPPSASPATLQFFTGTHHPTFLSPPSSCSHIQQRPFA